MVIRLSNVNIIGVAARVIDCASVSSEICITSVTHILSDGTQNTQRAYGDI